MKYSPVFIFFGFFFYLISLFGGLSSALRVHRSMVLGSTSTISSSELLSLSNLARREHGLETLTPVMSLEIAAQAKADDMLARNYWSHIADDMTTPWNFMEHEGYFYEHAGENLARNFERADKVVDAWLNSPSHRANLLSGDYTETGIGIAYGLNEHNRPTVIIVQFLAKPWILPADHEMNSQPFSRFIGVEPNMGMMEPLAVIGIFGLVLSLLGFAVQTMDPVGRPSHSRQSRAARLIHYLEEHGLTRHGR